MKLLRGGLILAAAAAVLVLSSGSARAWYYGETWIINPTLQGTGWNTVASGGFLGAPYSWAQGQDGVRRAWWTFDNSVTHGDAPTTPQLFIIWQWVPAANSTQWLPIEVNLTGDMNHPDQYPVDPNIPWAGQFGTNHQYLGMGENNQGIWVLAGAGPQSPQPYMVYAKAGSSFYTKWDFSFPVTDPHSVSAIMIQVVPEPGGLLALASGLVGLFGLGLRRRLA